MPLLNLIKLFTPFSVLRVYFYAFLEKCAVSIIVQHVCAKKATKRRRSGKQRGNLRPFGNISTGAAEVILEYIVG